MHEAFQFKLLLAQKVFDVVVDPGYLNLIGSYLTSANQLNLAVGTEVIH